MKDFFKILWGKFTKKEEKDVHQFMPGVQGILEEPSRGSQRLIPVIVFVFVISTALWMWFSMVDIVSPAQATLLPSSKIKLVQTKQVNVIDEILVAEGEVVAMDQPLVRFVGRDVDLNMESLQRQIKSLTVKKINWEAYEKFLNTGNKSYFLAGLSSQNLLLDEDVKVEKNIFDSKVNSYLADVDFINARIEGLQSRIKVVKLELKRLKEVVVYAEKEAENSKFLFEKEIISEEVYDEKMQRWQEVNSSIAITEEQIKQANSEYASLVKEKASKKKQELLVAADQLSEITMNLNKLKDDLALWNEESSGKILRASISGKVTELNIHTRGGVVQSGEILMKIVPQYSPLEAEAKVMNRDIGFVSVGQNVNVKIDSFNFTKYGYIAGVVTAISESSELDEQLGPIFYVNIELKQNFIRADGEKFLLKPGMTAIVDIKIGKRRLAEYIISPMLRYRDEAMRER